MVIGTFALFLKTDMETIFIFLTFFHKFEILDKVETGHCTHWNIGKEVLFYRLFICLFVLLVWFIFSELYFVTSVQEHFSNLYKPS